LKVISGIRCFMFFIFLSSILIFRLKWQCVYSRHQMITFHQARNLNL
jgi:hypothetical protein